MTGYDRPWWAAGVAAAVVAVDQVTKVGYTGVVHGSTALSSADTPQSGRQLAAGVILTAVVLFLCRRPWWALGLFAGGALSLAVDRVLYDGVRNPIAYGPLWWNVADPLFLAGAVALVVFLLVDLVRAHEQREEET